MIEIYDDRVEITSPGGLPKGLKEADFGKISLLRNPGIADFMQRIEYIEKMGTGIKRMEKLIKDAGLKSIRYEFSSFVRLVFYRFAAADQAAAQAAAQATAQATAQDEQTLMIVDFCKTPRTVYEIMAYLGLKHREYFRKSILKPLLEYGVLAQTIPEKPKSPNQKYVTVKSEGTNNEA